MSGQELYLELQNSINSLDIALRELKKRGREKSQTEHDYRIKLAEKILEERDKGTPVTIMSDICRGTPSIAKLKLTRDIAETLYVTALEAINIYKLKIKILENQIEREWGK